MFTIKDTLKLAYSKKCSDIIWKLVLDDDQHIVLWECRSKEKQVSFYAYDFINGCVLLDNYTFEENWLLVISHVINGIAYFHSYESESSPVQKGIIAFDLKSKETLWQNFSFGVQLFSKNGIIVFDSKILPRKFKQVNALNGVLKKEISLADMSTEIPLGNEISLPKFSNQNDLDAASYLLKYNELQITSFYKKEEQYHNQYIEVKKNDKLVFSDIINEDIQKLSFDTFFVWKSMLVYIRNKTEIVSYFV